MIFGKKQNLPNFLIVGAQKSATRWLRDSLSAHPDIFMANREVEFFNHNYGKGSKWYAEWFKDAEKHQIKGEATPGYMMLTDDIPRTVQRIRDTIPDVKIIALLRNPVDRTASAFIHHVRMRRISQDANFMGVIDSLDRQHDKLGLISGSLYAESLSYYYKEFGGEDILVLLHDDVSNEPHKLYKDTLSFIGADPSFTPSGLDQVMHSNRKEVSNGVVKSSAINADDRLSLYTKYFKNDITELEKLTGLDFSMWKPASSYDKTKS